MDALKEKKILVVDDQPQLLRMDLRTTGVKCVSSAEFFVCIGKQ